MNSRKLRSAAFFFAVVASPSAAYWFANSLNERELPNGGLSIPESKLQLGDVFENKTFFWTLPLTNNGSKKKELSAFTFSCRCAEVSPPSLALEPGETKELKLSLNLSSEGPASSPTRNLDVSIAPHFRDSAFPSGPGWKVSARVLLPFSLHKEFVFPDSLVHGQDPPDQVIRLKGLVRIARLEAIPFVNE